ncbi:MAG: transporter, partial [Marmoricola sp.]|nr:transporter [Marmoricola sp.]
LRLGRNNGEFDAHTVSSSEVVAAITGATDNVVTRRRDRLQNLEEQSGMASSHDGKETT